jgi:putative aldouronate transport system substrate-binding protein
MFRTKKTAKAGALALLASAILTGGCSSNQGANVTPSTSADPGVGASPTAAFKEDAGIEDFVNISWYMRKPIDNVKDQEAVEAEANKIIKEQLNANLKFNLIDVASWDDKMKLMSAAGESYDLVFTSGWTNRIDLNVQKGAFLPLDDLLEKYGQDILEKVDPRAWKAVTFNGQIMGVPAQTPYSQPMAYVFKKELVDKYQFNYKEVKSLQDLEPFLETIKENEPGIIPLLAVGSATMPGLLSFDYTNITNGVLYDEKNDAVIPFYDVEENMNNYRTLNDYYKKGYVAKDAAIKTDWMAEAKSGKYAVQRDSGGYTEDGSKSTGVLGFPTAEALAGYPLIQTGSMSGAVTAISKTSKNPERAMMLLNLIWKDKTLSNTLAYGIEGKNYTVKSGKGTDNPTIEANSGAAQTWAIWHNWLGPLWDQWDSNWNSTEALEVMRKNNDTAETSKLLGFIFNPDPVKLEVAQVNAVFTEVNPILNSGSMQDFDQYIEECKQKLKNAGIDKLQAEVQKQIDEWKKQN